MSGVKGLISKFGKEVFAGTSETKKTTNDDESSSVTSDKNNSENFKNDSPKITKEVTENILRVNKDKTVFQNPVKVDAPKNRNAEGETEAAITTPPPTETKRMSVAERIAQAKAAEAAAKRPVETIPKPVKLTPTSTTPATPVVMATAEHHHSHPSTTTITASTTRAPTLSQRITSLKELHEQQEKEKEKDKSDVPIVTASVKPLIPGPPIVSESPGKKSISISDRIAALKSSNATTTEAVKPSAPDMIITPSKETVTEGIATPASEDGDKDNNSTAPMRRSSVADRIAAMKTTNNNSSPPPPPSRPATTVRILKSTPMEDSTTAITVSATNTTVSSSSGGIAASAASDETIAIATDVAVTTIAIDANEGVEKDNNSTAPAVKRSSVADRIAAMKTTPEKTTPPPPPAAAAITIKPMVPPPATPSSPPIIAITDNNNNDEEPVNKKSSIADRIAALKSSGSSSSGIPSIAENTTTDNSASSAPVPPPSRRMSQDKLKIAGAINLAGFNPMAPRPPFFPKPSPAVATMSESDAATITTTTSSSIELENGEKMQHHNLSRVTVPSEKRRSTRLGRNFSLESAISSTM